MMYVMVYIVKGGGRAPPPLPGWADFSIMMECTPESSNCHSVDVICHRDSKPRQKKIAWSSDMTVFVKTSMTIKSINHAISTKFTK